MSKYSVRAQVWLTSEQDEDLRDRAEELGIKREPYIRMFLFKDRDVKSLSLEKKMKLIHHHGFNKESEKLIQVKSNKISNSFSLSNKLCEKIGSNKLLDDETIKIYLIHFIDNKSKNFENDKDTRIINGLDSYWYQTTIIGANIDLIVYWRYDEVEKNILIYDLKKR